MCLISKWVKIRKDVKLRVILCRRINLPIKRMSFSRPLSPWKIMKKRRMKRNKRARVNQKSSRGSRLSMWRVCRHQ
jgi:hypothetical protein